MDWNSTIKGFVSYLQLEKSLSPNSIDAYKRDLTKLQKYATTLPKPKSPSNITQDDLEGLLKSLNELEILERSQARLVSAIKGFYKYMVLENIIKENPAQLIEAPKLPKTLPVYLTLEEVDAILGAIDMSHPQGQRNRAIIETLYACGLRVTELINMKISNLFLDVEVIRVIGKGDRERLVPINSSAIKHLRLYMNEIRKHQKIEKGYEDFVFLNRRGKPLSRVMIFMIIKDLVLEAGIQKNVSPHTFRHTFATHLYEAGADLRAIQDMLGHRSILTTEIYSHVNTRYLKNTLEKYHPRFQ